MDKKTPKNFNNHEEWLSYVRDNIPAVEQPYVLACGRTELFKDFYEVRKQTFPIEFAVELERIRMLSDPQRTNDLESLNKRIFAGLTEFLFNQARPKPAKAEPSTSVSPREEVQTLLDYLAKKNPYFALWTVYKKSADGKSSADDWEDHLRKELGTDSGDEVVFTRAMAELDKLLLYFRDKNIPLPRHFYERAWFLHYLPEPERMVQTRVLLNTLTAEIGTCTSA